MRNSIWALVAALLVTAGPAFASGGAKGDFELGVYGGFGWVDDHGIYHPKDNELFGARLGYFVSRHFGLEAMGQRMPTKMDEDLFSPSIGDAEMHFNSYRLNGLLNFLSSERFRPFITAGGGYESFDVEGFTDTKDFGWNAGAGFRWYLTPAVNLRADGRYVSTKIDELDETDSNIEATLGLGLTFGGYGSAGSVAEEIEAPPPNHPPTVTCSVDRSEVLPGETVNVTAAATDPDGDPLTYQWSSSAGRVTGNATTAAFDFSGATPPANATITVRVSDNHGNTATSDCSVAMAQPPPKAEAVSCLAGGFPRNLSRITNVDKACLDDVAQRLSADPRATVVVIGHADSHERTADRIAQQRADAVKNYLVSERHIETSRITVRSSGSSKPLETGADATSMERNRRVEVWFVPEGTTIPE
jgi:outer membrane protein OmpA-like peptidoglycan-associated protein/opacity protein-like surface antigen